MPLVAGVRYAVLETLLELVPVRPGLLSGGAPQTSSQKTVPAAPMRKEEKKMYFRPFGTVTSVGFDIIFANDLAATSVQAARWH